MKTSGYGVEFIKNEEKLITHVYLDIVGIPTVCVGHVVLPSEKEKFANREVPEEECIEVLRIDLNRFERAVERLVRYPISQAMFDALVSFTFNVGTGALQHSTLRMKLNRGEVEEAADEFLKWCRAGGKKVRGLLLRRARERDLFLG